jgi:hypothetical protein
VFMPVGLLHGTVQGDQDIRERMGRCRRKMQPTLYCVPPWILYYPCAWQSDACLRSALGREQHTHQVAIVLPRAEKLGLGERMDRRHAQVAQPTNRFSLFRFRCSASAEARQSL